MATNKKRLFKVRIQKPDGRRATYEVRARNRSEAAGRQSAKGQVVSTVQVG